MVYKAEQGPPRTMGYIWYTEKSRDILKHRGYVVYGAAQGPLSSERVYVVCGL